MTIQKKKGFAAFAGALSATVLLGACGDEVTNISETTGMQIIEKGEKVPNCTDKTKGELIYVLDSAEAFFCANGEWQSWKGEKGEKGEKGDKGKDGSNGTNGKNGTSCTTKQVEGGIEVSCPGSDPVTIKNGTNGTNGEDGKSCTTKQTENGIEVTCPGSDPVTIKNGTAGAAGKSAYDLSGTDKTLEEWLASLKGSDGKSCTTKEVEDGIEVSCPGSDPVTIKNGTTGEKGANGKSCTVVENAQINGYDVKSATMTKRANMK